MAEGLLIHCLFKLFYGVGEEKAVSAKELNKNV